MTAIPTTNPDVDLAALRAQLAAAEQRAADAQAAERAKAEVEAKAKYDQHRKDLAAASKRGRVLEQRYAEAALALGVAASDLLTAQKEFDDLAAAVSRYEQPRGYATAQPRRPASPVAIPMATYREARPYGSLRVATVVAEWKQRNP